MLVAMYYLVDNFHLRAYRFEIRRIDNYHCHHHRRLRHHRLHHHHHHNLIW